MVTRPSGTARVLLIGGSPHASSAHRIRAAARSCDAVVCVDRGLDAALAAGVSCDVHCGDGDSISAAGAERLRQGAALAAMRYDPHKDFTDLAGALRAVDERWPHADLVVTCCFGGSPDHLLGVLGRLRGWEGAVEISEDDFCGRVLRAGGRWEINDAIGRRFSFIPLSAEAIVSERGMRWELDRARVELLCDLGISNVIERADASIVCHAGDLIAWVFTRPRRSDPH